MDATLTSCPLALGSDDNRGVDSVSELVASYHSLPVWVTGWLGESQALGWLGYPVQEVVCKCIPGIMSLPHTLMKHPL